MDGGGTDWRGAGLLEVQKEEYDHNESGVRAGPVSNGRGGVWPNEPSEWKGAGGSEMAEGEDSVGRRREQRQEPRAASCVIISPA